MLVINVLPYYEYKKFLGINLESNYAVEIGYTHSLLDCILFRFGVGKKGMEKICLEESFHLNEKIRKSNGKPCNVSVKRV